MEKYTIPVLDEAAFHVYILFCWKNNFPLWFVTEYMCSVIIRVRCAVCIAERERTDQLRFERQSFVVCKLQEVILLTGLKVCTDGHTLAQAHTCKDKRTIRTHMQRSLWEMHAQTHKRLYTDTDTHL